jgi:hypothetical protein
MYRFLSDQTINDEIMSKIIITCKGHCQLPVVYCLLNFFFNATAIHHFVAEIGILYFFGFA